MRVAGLGVVACVLFAVVFFRLWYLQVLSGDQYLAQAQTNRVREQPLPAPRGSIVDRNGTVIVDNRPAIVVRIKPESLPDSEKKAAAGYGEAVIARSKRPDGRKRDPIAIPPVPSDLQARFAKLADTLGMRPQTIQDRVIRGLFLAGYAPVIVKTDVEDQVQGYIAERQEQFPGVSVDNVFLRDYPQKELAAQLLGTASEITADQLKDKAYRGIPSGSVIGQSGIEAQYDQFLRGRDGQERLLVDAQGNPRGTGRRRDPVPGRNVQLTLDLRLQKAAQDTYRSIAGSLPGAFVAMDPRNGDVLAMGSFPTFDPSVLVGEISQKRYDEIFNDGSTPQFNRVIGANYATGSTFKPVTALGALEAGDITPSEIITDTGCITIGVQERCNAKKEVFGPVDMRNALRVSSDIYFYTLGQRTNVRDNPKGGPIQKSARKLGFDRRTGIDLPGESKGLVPDPAWRRRVAKEEIAYEKKNSVPCCTISDKRPWSIGDNVSLSIGQGDLQATPLQMAVAYAGIAQEGRVPRPRLGKAVQDDSGLEIQQLPASPARRVKVEPEYRSAIMDGLHLAASADGGTSTAVFSGWNQSRFPVYGKTGTAQVVGKEDQSWYVAYSYDGPDRRRPIVIAATVEEGGFGAARAAPIACLIMKRWFGKANNVDAGCAGGSDASF